MSVAVTPEELVAHRNRSIRLAVATSLLSKVGTLVLRLVSIPLAIRLLGIDQFGIYTAITMAVGIIDIMHVGIGPALTREISRAVAKGDRDREKHVLITGFLLSTGLTLLAAVAAALLLFFVPIPTLFGEKFAPLSGVMYNAAWIGLIILAVEMICVVFERVRDGYMETRYTNSWGAGGNVLGAALLLGGIWFFPTIEFLLIAVNGSIALAKLGNTIHFFVQRPYLLPKFALFRPRLVRPLALDGLQFSITYILAAMVEYNLMAFLIGRAVGPSAVGVFNVMITIHFSLTGLLTMFTTPYWPALMDAHERGDLAWIEKSARLGRLAILGFAAFCSVGLIVLGPWILPIWASESFTTEVPEGFQVGRIALCAFSAYFAIHIWRVLNQVFALGIGQIRPVSRVVMAEAVLIAIVGGLVLYQSKDITYLYAAMTLTIAAITGWALPWIFRTRRSLPHPVEE